MDAVEDEWYAVRHSGEIPEVALCSALYYLSHDPGGPGLRLTREQEKMLVQAAEMRYQEIVLRDLQPSQENMPGYRGIKRSIINWQRYLRFCSRQRIDADGFRAEVATGLLLFVREGLLEAESRQRDISINCTYVELCCFAAELGLSASLLPESVRQFCRS